MWLLVFILSTAWFVFNVVILVKYYLGSNGELLYAKLMREEILACDKELIKRAKKAGAIGGKKIIEICQ